MQVDLQFSGGAGGIAGYTREKHEVLRLTLFTCVSSLSLQNPVSCFLEPYLMS